MTKTTEKVHFRFIEMPCCQTQLCWINHRLPFFCPECGKHIFPEVKKCIKASDKNAILKADYLK